MTNSEITFVVVESAEGCYEARALGYSIFTEADNYDDLERMVQDAVTCHFEPGLRPRLVRLFFVKGETLTM
jgi:hypothetical protein